jgi:predicted ferric reductase
MKDKNKLISIILFILAIVAINGLIIALFFVRTPTTLSDDPLYSFVRLCALLGIALMFISAILTPFQKELYQIFKKPFLRIHHSTAITGLVLITAHPVFLAIDVALFSGNARQGAAVFVPDFSSFISFLTLAGRPALYLIYIAVASFFLRKAWKKGWRILHSINYIALIFGVIHGIIIGQDIYGFSGPVDIPGLVLTILYLLMLVATTVTFTLKRIQLSKRKKKKKPIDEKIEITEEIEEDELVD